MKSRNVKIGLAVGLALTLIGGAGVVGLRFVGNVGRTNVIGYFANSNGIYVGDDVVVLGVKVGRIERIEPQPHRVKVSFWYDDKYTVPADAKAVILSPSLVTARTIQLTPAYTSGPVMRDDAVIPQDRTAVPVEWDDLRQQLEKLTETLRPTQPGGVSTLGAFINTAAGNLRGQGGDIRGTVVKLSQAVSALGDHSGDLFSTVKNVSVLVSALQDSSGLLGELNQNLAAVSGVLANDSLEIDSAVKDLREAAAEVTTFIADNRETLGVTTDKLAAVSQTVMGNLDTVKQILHLLPHVAQNFNNIYQPAQGTLSGIAVVNNFANPLGFLCGAVQAASRLGAEQSAKLCAQYLAPIIKNRAYNFPPLGENLFVGASARPNEITYSEDWMRPDYIPPQPPSQPDGPTGGSPLPAEAALSDRVSTDPADGLPGLMVPPGEGQ